MLRHLTVRPGRFSDGDFVKTQIIKLSLLAEGFKTMPKIRGIDETWKKIINDPKSPVFIAEENGKPVCACTTSLNYQLHRGGEVLYIQELSVDESARKSGAGKAILEALEKYCKEKGIVAIDLTQPPPKSGYDEIRNKFYQKNGYELTGMGRTKEFQHNFVFE
ncbi:acetyltransferase, GNAT family protein [Trichomonas vaginalis G3]|uniref:Acetyltransferase, GNAT family protein n=1 Tax=Trichomonas vaginalis (strain ATCC PRA-98 / G3) TaxID=412133 RepID=A2ECH4_TRIV3|nr:histone acetyltransferase HPA2 and related acetyltransferases family [Trichomonas vaginalis G3]EAY09669.1 acetyltransferase, GNAT family protein [Trichomonas vaginalis G3]KAI5528670.1 histone acetyltransferase HPA2 and related acetyltransferases family [Trichomonas vaginalis G3]|eukprot:XP_001321892.1 acetyltransferase, GNAT family protein [Trichomonas vaginalis G3]